MRYALVYSSLTGNTAKLAGRIRAVLGEDCTYFGAPDARALCAPNIFVGFWTDRGSCDDTLRSFMGRLSAQRICLFGTAGFGGSEEYFEQILSRVGALVPPGVQVVGGYMCQGSMEQGVRTRYEHMLSEDPTDTKAREMLKNFDLARTHPDDADLEQAAHWAYEMKALLK